jgi:6-phosphogluconolactonase
MHFHIYKDPEAFNISASDWIVDEIAKVLSQKDKCTIALSGGNTPRAIYKLLSASPRKDKIDWSRMHVFWGDERAVPFEDPRNNAKMAFDTLLGRVNIPPSQIHVMRTDIAPEQSAHEYEKILKTYFENGTPEEPPITFDLVLLGMGDDGHTLSLFPGMTEIFEDESWTMTIYLPSQNMFRITLTRVVVNLSSRIAFFAIGAGKAKALMEVLQGSFHPEAYPSQLIQPVYGELHWFVDEAAASQLK